jgi:hypothetical protein
LTRQEILQKILDAIPKRKNVRLHLAPRFGKTKLIIDLIKRDNPLSILWVTPSRKLAEEDIPGEFEKWGGEEYLGRVISISHSQSAKYKNNNKLMYCYLLRDYEMPLAPTTSISARTYRLISS